MEFGAFGTVLVNQKGQEMKNIKKKKVENLPTYCEGTENSWVATHT